MFAGCLSAVIHVGEQLPVNFETLLLPQAKYSVTKPSGVRENDEIRYSYYTDFLSEVTTSSYFCLCERFKFQCMIFNGKFLKFIHLFHL